MQGMQNDFLDLSLIRDFTPLKTRELMEIVKQVGQNLMETAPSETVVGNMTRRVLKIIRDEYATLQKGKQEDADLQDSLQKILTADEADFDYCESIPSLKPAIMEHIGEFLTELDSRFLSFKLCDLNSHLYSIIIL